MDPRVLSTASLTTATDSAEVAFTLPSGEGPVDVALVDKRGNVIQLANEGEREDGWLEVTP
jgi:hypothetical protein